MFSMAVTAEERTEPYFVFLLFIVNPWQIEGFGLNFIVLQWEEEFGVLENDS